MSASSLNVLIVAADDDRAAVLQRGVEALRAERVQRLRDLRHLPRRLETLDPDVGLIDAEGADPGVLAAAFDVAKVVAWPIVVFVDDADTQTVQAAIEADVAAFVIDGFVASRVKAIVDVALIRFGAVRRLRAELSAAQLALEERKLIERAKSILMKQRKMAEDEAYALLRQSAMRQNRKMADLARSLIAAAQLIGDSDR